MADEKILTLSDFTLPEEISTDIFSKAQGASTIARLCGAEPQKFGKSEVMVLTGFPKAELVGEGAAKNPTDIAFVNKPVTPHKFQVTVRMSEEVKWADEDHQLGILREAFAKTGEALGRALDLAFYHKLNPLTGTVSALITEGITDTTKSVTLSDDAYTAAVEAAVKEIIDEGYTATGIALDPAFAFGLATEKDADGYNLHAGMGFGQNVDNFLGINAAVSDTVSAKNDAETATGIKAIVGQFDACRWGVQRSIGASFIEFGDPDGLGDLKRHNQVAVRAEIVYGFGILDKDAFVKIV